MISNARLAAKKNHDIFCAGLDRLESMIDRAELEPALQLAHELAHHAWTRHSGIFVSLRLEKLLARISSLIPVETTAQPQTQAHRRQVLIVMSSAHAVGGHSRIAWRWVRIDPSSEHTLVLTDQNQAAVPQQLLDLEAEGLLRIVRLQGPGWVSRVQALRALARQADQIVLLTHPDDVTPCAALPAMADAPPVLLLDHASHVFWLGVTITRLVLNTATFVIEKRRGIPPQNIGWALLPMDFERLANPRAFDVRAAFGIPQDAVLLLSCGSPFKYWSIENVSLAALVAPVLEKHANAHLLVVGVTPTPFWNELAARFPARVHLHDYMREPELVTCYHACDIYLDSLPLSSPTTLLEAAAVGKPMVRFAPQDWRGTGFSLEFEGIPTPFYLWSDAKDYAADVSRLISDPEFRQWRADFCQKAVQLYYADATFRHTIELLYARAANTPLIAARADAEEFTFDRLDQLLASLTHNQLRQSGKGEVDVRLLAFYLPQFHAIPENNAWWGEGFTEWTNVRRAQPLFEGHEQPLAPGELGYYDLSDVGVMERQAQLAREHGVHGFCFYYYWFDGKRLLEKPVDQLLKAPHIDLPFCLCWANENWTKRWDGGEQEVLMRQSYSPALNERFAADMTPYFSDPRYIRVNGKPLFLVYRTDIIPELKQTVAAWRAAWRAAGVGEVYLVAVESFQSIVPEAFGFDAAVDFPPHQVHLEQIPPDQSINAIADPAARIGDYGQLRQAWLARPTPEYKRFRGLVPSWDNTSRRRKGGATLFVNASPEGYQEWLTQSVANTLKEFAGEERLVFVNAWNEWAEGCTLEPSAQHGRAYLEATRKVMARSERELLAELAPLDNSFAAHYRSWLEARPDRLTLRDAPTKSDSLPRIALQVLIAQAPGDMGATLASLKAQLRQPDAVLTGKDDWGQLARTAAKSWVLLLSPGDVLEEDALLQIERALRNEPAADSLLLYTDHDERDAAGALINPHLKPDFNHGLLLSYPYMGRAVVVRGDWAAQALASSSKRLDIAFAHRLALRALREQGSSAFVHLPSPLLHLSTQEPAVFCTTSEAWQALAQVLQDHLQQTAPGAQAVEGPTPGSFHVVHPLPRTPLVSIIIPTREQAGLLGRCIESLLGKTNYPNFEIIVVDNGSETAEARELLNGLEQLDPQRLRVLRAPGAFNFSRMNNRAAEIARGEFILMLNNDVAALQPDWLSHMVRHALREDVGAVGARLLYPDGRVQHAGVVLGLRGPAEHPCLGLDARESGYLFRAQVQQDFSAVTAACLLVSKALYQSLGGLDEENFGVSYNDVDFCLRVGAAGRRVVWTPLATLLHEGSASQKSSIENIGQTQKFERFSREQAAMYARWSGRIAHDPAYNPNLSLSKQGYELESDVLLRRQPPRTEANGHRVMAYPGDVQGCGHYRVIQPLQAMIESGLCHGGMSMQAFPPHLALRTQADTFIFQRPYSDLGLELLQALSAIKGLRKIYDADDVEYRLPPKSAHYELVSKDTRGRVAKAIGLCDRLIVSTAPLAHELKGMNDDIRVAPNRLAPAMWGATPPPARATDAPRRSGKPRVGWAGGVSHLGDLEIVAQVIRELADEVDWVFMGMCPDSIRPYVREFYAGVPTLLYPKRLMAQDWDLAIAPLEINAFNECKSNLRLLEYGWCGAPVVCTDITPYQGDLPVTRVKNRHKDWVEAIRTQLSDLAALRAQGQALQAQVAAEWTLSGTHLQQWHATWTT